MRMIAAKLKWPLLLPALVLGLLAFAPGTASAQLVDPSTLQIGGPTGPYGGHPNQIGPSGIVTIDQNQGSTSNLTQPWLLVLALPTASTNFFNGIDPITSVTYSNPAPGGSGTGTGGFNNIAGAGLGTLYGGSWNTTSGYAGALDGSTKGLGGKGQGDMYSVVGLNGPTNDSPNFPNLQGYDSSINGVNASSFAIYVLEIGAELDGKGQVTVTFNKGVLPLGTYIVGYGEADGKYFDTPFTQAGLTTGQNSPVPEPATIALALSGLVSGGIVGLRRLRRRQAATV